LPCQRQSGGYQGSSCELSSKLSCINKKTPEAATPPGFFLFSNTLHQ
jgi:hypothetical protein